MKILFTLLFLTTPSLAAGSKPCVEKFPKIRKTIEALQPLQVPGLLNFKKLVQKIKAAESVVNDDKEREALQSIGCGGVSSDALNICVKPLLWSCEALPFSIDRKFLSEIKKSKTEEQALLTGQLLESENLFATCCGDFGCHPTGVGIPDMFQDKGKAEALTDLALDSGVYGNIAFGTLKASVDGLSRATCGCNIQNGEPLGIVRTLMAVQVSIKKTNLRANQVHAFYGKIIGMLERGLPKEICKLPGY